MQQLNLAENSIMKTSVFNSNSISLAHNPKITDIVDFGGMKDYAEVNKKKLTGSEKRQLKGMVKSFLGVAYFVSLVYFLFVLLS